MWYETAMEEIGVEKNLEMDISLVAHTEDPQRTREQMRRALLGRNGK